MQLLNVLRIPVDSISTNLVGSHIDGRLEVNLSLYVYLFQHRLANNISLSLSLQ